MVSEEIFESALRSAGDLAGVFEYDGETAYFYLYEASNGKQRVLGAIHLLSGQPNFTEAEIAVRWDGDEEHVGLFIRGELWAVFDAGGNKLGGSYLPGAETRIPAAIQSRFVLAD